MSKRTPVASRERVIAALMAAGDRGLTGSEAGQQTGVLVNTARAQLHYLAKDGDATVVGTRPNERDLPEFVYALRITPGRMQAMYDYRATVIRWVDGDTVDAKVDVGFYLSATLRFRLLGSTGGVDTPELRAKDPAMRLVAQRAHMRSLELAPVGGDVRMLTEKADEFGRWLARIILADGRDLGDVLLAEGLAVRYVRGAS